MMKFGSVTAAFSVYSDFLTYSGGVYSNKSGTGTPSSKILAFSFLLSQHAISGGLSELFFLRRLITTHHPNIGSCKAHIYARVWNAVHAVSSKMTQVNTWGGTRSRSSGGERTTTAARTTGSWPTAGTRRGARAASSESFAASTSAASKARSSPAKCNDTLPFKQSLVLCPCFAVAAVPSRRERDRFYPHQCGVVYRSGPVSAGCGPVYVVVHLSQARSVVWRVLGDGLPVAPLMRVVK